MYFLCIVAVVGRVTLVQSSSFKPEVSQKKMKSIIKVLVNEKSVSQCWFLVCDGYAID